MAERAVVLYVFDAGAGIRNDAGHCGQRAGLVIDKGVQTDETAVLGQTAFDDVGHHRHVDVTAAQRQRHRPSGRVDLTGHQGRQCGRRCAFDDGLFDFTQDQNRLRDLSVSDRHHFIDDPGSDGKRLRANTPDRETIGNCRRGIDGDRLAVDGAGDEAIALLDPGERGLIEPEDDIRDTNPPSNPELLDALARHFVDSGYDLKAVVRVIAQSSAYQLSAVPNQHNGVDTQNFSRFYPRRMQAEVLLDAVDQFTGAKTDFADLPPGTTASIASFTLPGVSTPFTPGPTPVTVRDPIGI